jgi:hypothetical protein
MRHEKEFFVEGRWFPDSLQAFTFAEIQADRMQRPVHVHYGEPNYAVSGKGFNWHATAYPSYYIRNHVVRENSPQRKVLAAEAA